MIRERYVVWNNKGGVGKSTLTFHIASLYADTHPEEKVLVIDLCPQANATMMLLGSGANGEERLIELENRDPAPTIAGYLSERIKVQAGTASKNGHRWHLKVKDYNENLPENLFLVAGDGNLELLAGSIAYYANAQFPPGAWGAVHSWVRELIEKICAKGEAPWTVFIDTNPSFAIYTELAMIAADKLLVPFNADDSSRHAVSAIVRLLYGEGKANPVYDKFTFRSRLAENKLVAPRFHLFIGNRFTQYKGAAKAFSAVSSAVATELHTIYSRAPQLFTERKRRISTYELFLDQYVTDVNNFNTAGVVAAHCGILLNHLTQKNYDVHGQEIEVKSERVVGCKQSLEKLVAKL